MIEPIGQRTRVDEGQTSKLYYVWNTADRRMMVLAQNQATAKNLAHTYNHVHDIANARTAEVDPTKPKPHEEKFFAAVRSAIRDGRQGVVKNMDGFAIVGARSQISTYAPIVEVKR